MRRRRSGAWTRTRMRLRGSSRDLSTKYNRWNSPKYIFGESYGTTRSAVLADILENSKSDRSERRDSAVADLQFHDGYRYADGEPGRGSCPTCWRCRRMRRRRGITRSCRTQPAALEPFLKEVEEFAHGAYAHALAQGTDVSADRRSRRWRRSCMTIRDCRWRTC